MLAQHQLPQCSLPIIQPFSLLCICLLVHLSVWLFTCLSAHFFAYFIFRFSSFVLPVCHLVCACHPRLRLLLPNRFLGSSLLFSSMLYCLLLLLLVVDCICCYSNHLSAARHSIRYLFVQLLVDGVRQVDNATLNKCTHKHTRLTPPHCFGIFICFACQ